MVVLEADENQHEEVSWGVLGLMNDGGSEEAGGRGNGLEIGCWGYLMGGWIKSCGPMRPDNGKYIQAGWGGLEPFEGRYKRRLVLDDASRVGGMRKL